MWGRGISRNTRGAPTLIQDAGLLRDVLLNLNLMICDTLAKHSLSLNWTLLQVSVGGMANWQLELDSPGCAAVFILGRGRIGVKQLCGDFSA